MRKPFKPLWLDACIKKGPSLLEGIVRIFSKIEPLLPVYETVARWRKPLEHIVNLLEPDPDKTSEFFRQTKANHRRITGLRNWNSYIQRNGELIVLIRDALRQEHIEHRLRSVDYTVYKNCEVNWRSRLNEHVERKRFNRDPEAYLAALEHEWDKMIC